MTAAEPVRHHTGRKRLTRVEDCGSGTVSFSRLDLTGFDTPGLELS